MQIRKSSGLRKKRQFICPCGKEYYSYPALYTHIKSSHGGKAPGEIRRPDIPSRGRPKIPGSLRINQYSRKILSNVDNPISLLIEAIKEEPCQKPTEIIDIIKNLLKGRKIQNQLELIIANDISSSEVSISTTEKLKKIKTGQGMGKFLKDIDQFLNQQHSMQIRLLMVMFLEHVTMEAQDDEILNTSSFPFLLDFANDFIINGYPNEITKLTHQRIKYISTKNQENQQGEPDHSNSQITFVFWIENKENAIMALDVLFKWMMYKHYTLTKAKRNPDFGKQP